MQLTKRTSTRLLNLVRVSTLCLCAIIMSCDQTATSTSKTTSSKPISSKTPQSSSITQNSATTTQDKIWPLGYIMLKDAALNTQTLNGHIEQLLKAPSAEHMQSAKQSWQKTAASLESFYPFTRLGIIEAQHFKPLIDTQADTSSWPIQPGYLDAYGPHIYSGLIFDVGSPINENTLRNQHGLTDAEDVTLGIYAIEFLLFGENNLRSHIMFKPILALTEPDVKQGYQSPEELPRNRRRALLDLQAKLLEHDIANLTALWSSDSAGSMASSFQYRSEASRHTLLVQAIQSTLTEQILSIAEMTKLNKTQKPEDRQWRSQQLADRIVAQLNGLSKILASSSEAKLQKLAEPSTLCAATVNKLSTLAPTIRNDLANEPIWTESYDCIRLITRDLDQ